MVISRIEQPVSPGASRLSPYLKYGLVHPRQLLAKLGPGVGPPTFKSELCWRDFYADVLFNRPDTVNHAYRSEMAGMSVSSGKQADAYFEAWASGMTGYPMVDAGMRQLLGEAWVHNRVRMIVASFLVKDLHLDWHRGAVHFMHHLVDGDIASNTHGWQWTAGTGPMPPRTFEYSTPLARARNLTQTQLI